MTIEEGRNFLRRLDKILPIYRNVEVVICPTMVALHPLSKEIKGEKVKLGVQNIHYADHGTFTGEVSAPMVKDIASYALVGHSDRRRKFHEDEDMIARKVAACLRNGLTPVLCVGEDLISRQNNEADIVIHDQVAAGLVMLTGEDIENVVIAYEPIWSISEGDGKGAFANPDIVAKAVKVIRRTIESLYGKKAAAALRIIYGGSSNPDDAGAYLSIPGIDGLLPGGASMNYHSFAAMVEIAHAKAKPNKHTK